MAHGSRCRARGHSRRCRDAKVGARLLLSLSAAFWRPSIGSAAAAPGLGVRLECGRMALTTATTFSARKEWLATVPVLPAHARLRRHARLRLSFPPPFSAESSADSRGVQWTCELRCLGGPDAAGPLCSAGWHEAMTVRVSATSLPAVFSHRSRGFATVPHRSRGFATESTR